MNLLIPGDIRSGKVPSIVLHNAVLPRSDPREYIVYNVFTRQDVSQLDSDFVLQSPPPSHPYQPISTHILTAEVYQELRRVLDTASDMLSLD